jgi:hypothetical protein
MVRVYLRRDPKRFRKEGKGEQKFVRVLTIEEIKVKDLIDRI